MTVFEAARQADCVQAAEKLGIRTRRSGGKAYACCLFHAERTPSLCLYPDSGGFYCFGCHAHGDAVALYAQALSLSPLEAAKRVCADFGYDYDRRGKRGSYLPGKAPALNVRTLAKRLDDWREEKVRALLETQRAAEARMEQIEARFVARGLDFSAVAEDETWQAALVEKCAAQERIALLDSLSLPELLQEMKEETYGAQRTERAVSAAG